MFAFSEDLFGFSIFKCCHTVIKHLCITGNRIADIALVQHFVYKHLQSCFVASRISDKQGEPGVFTCANSTVILFSNTTCLSDMDDWVSYREWEWMSNVNSLFWLQHMVIFIHSSQHCHAGSAMFLHVFLAQDNMKLPPKENKNRLENSDVCKMCEVPDKTCCRLKKSTCISSEDVPCEPPKCQQSV